MALDVNGCAHVNYVCALNNQTVMTGYWLQALITGLDLSDVADAVTGIGNAQLVAAVPPDVTLVEIQVSDPRKDGEATVHRPFAPGTVGTLVGAALPGQNTIRTKLTTGFKSARRRGATLAIGLIEEAVANGHLGAPQFAPINAYHDVLRTTFGPAGTNNSFRWVTYSPENLTSTPPRPGIVITPVTDYAIDTLVRTLHRRQIGVGI